MLQELYPKRCLFPQDLKRSTRVKLLNGLGGRLFAEEAGANNSRPFAPNTLGSGLH
jgi:hypothetical protein